MSVGRWDPAEAAFTAALAAAVPGPDQLLQVHYLAASRLLKVHAASSLPNEGHWSQHVIMWPRILCTGPAQQQFFMMGFTRLSAT